MSLPICTISDFVGEFYITGNTEQKADLTNLIPNVEKRWIRLLFCDEMFIDVRDTITLPDKYKDLINGKEYLDANNKKQINAGFKQFLIRMIYCEFYKIDKFSKQYLNQNENSIINSSENVSSRINGIYNEAINLYLNDIVKFWEKYKSEVGYEIYLDFNMPVLRTTTIF